MHAAATSKVENSAQGSSCKLKFVHGAPDATDNSVSSTIFSLSGFVLSLSSITRGRGVIIIKNWLK
jgi:hypothetical protein